jgi:hypothetical protein
MASAAIYGMDDHTLRDVGLSRFKVAHDVPAPAPDVRFLRSILVVLVAATLVTGGVCVDLILDLPTETMAHLASR